MMKSVVFSPHILKIIKMKHHEKLLRDVLKVNQWKPISPAAEKMSDHSFIDFSRLYMNSRLAVQNWISSRYLAIELSKQLTLWPYRRLMDFFKRIFSSSKDR